MKQIVTGTQEKIAATVAAWLGYGNNAAARRVMREYIIVQREQARFTGRSAVVIYRGIGIDTTARRGACWIENPAELARWRKICAGVEE